MAELLVECVECELSKARGIFLQRNLFKHLQLPKIGTEEKKRLKVKNVFYSGSFRIFYYIHNPPQLLLT